MRVMVLIKADKNTEAGVMPSEQLLTEMGQFNEELVKAGVMLSGEGLHPSSKGVRVHFSGQRRSTTDGPFAETKELVAGFWMWQVKSMEEAVAWAKRCPNPTGEECEIEIRRVFEAEDFGAEFTPELREQEDRLRTQLEQQAAAPKVPAVPQQNGATPYLIVKGAPDAIAFYQRVFGAELKLRLDGPDGSVMHAELQIGPARFMLSEEQPQWGSLSPLSIGGSATSAVVYVPDVDTVFERAVAAGAKATMPVADQFWGDRSGHVVDPFGHQWFISTHIEDPSPDELQRRMAKMFEQGATPAG
jgi:uncharacterized glyoxalase superfamily protein PhnB